ncbi:OLC1v1039208C1 [Oldenlandia corymbosa var. corymbosa]|uniref:OLC1v1039208C1 n=1 Tax=Oldenlandia corymbosa var. corymbosa TaxID=529605 RepID=A0AAV1D1L2_OLDCO|nr:OLC1v1039208C1 [Oldenlandia corymbosa var. corymbosa]
MVDAAADYSPLPAMEERQQPLAMEDTKGILQNPANSLLRCVSIVPAAVATSAGKILLPPNLLSQSDEHISLLNKETSKSNSPSQQISPSSLEKEDSSPNISSNNSSQRLNPEVLEFTISILELIMAQKTYLSKDDMEIGNNTKLFNPSYSIEEINSESGLNHVSNGSEDEDFDMEYAMAQESFYSEISAPTYHNRLKKPKLKQNFEFIE